MLAAASVEAFSVLEIIELTFGEILVWQKGRYERWAAPLQRIGRATCFVHPPSVAEFLVEVAEKFDDGPPWLRCHGRSWKGYPIIEYEIHVNVKRACALNVRRLFGAFFHFGHVRQFLQSACNTPT